MNTFPETNSVDVSLPTKTGAQPVSNKNNPSSKRGAEASYEAAAFAIRAFSSAILA